MKIGNYQTGIINVLYVIKNIVKWVSYFFLTLLTFFNIFYFFVSGKMVNFTYDFKQKQNTKKFKNENNEKF